ATEDSKWNKLGSCADCSALTYCPFHQNAEWLRDPGTVSALRRILRRGELSNGQRWNFRDTFSLTAELMIGQWSDFGAAEHPCTWVHFQIEALQNEKTRGRAALKLAF